MVRIDELREMHGTRYHTKRISAVSVNVQLCLEARALTRGSKRHLYLGFWATLQLKTWDIPRKFSVILSARTIKIDSVGANVIKRAQGS